MSKCNYAYFNQINFDNLKDKADQGFTGFISVADLQKTECRDVPAEPGVYLFIRDKVISLSFIDHSIGGHFKGKDPTVPVAVLNKNWVDGAKVVYIGKAGNLNRKATLKSRLRAYMEFG